MRVDGSRRRAWRSWNSSNFLPPSPGEERGQRGKGKPIKGSLGPASGVNKLNTKCLLSAFQTAQPEVDQKPPCLGSNESNREA